MKTCELTIVNPSGLHARPAATFVSAAGKFQAAITIKNLDTDSKPVNAKSMLRLLSLALVKGTRVALTAQGDDEEAAIDALAELVRRGCGEV